MFVGKFRYLAVTTSLCYDAVYESWSGYKRNGSECV